jgi:hypothetical protein
MNKNIVLSSIFSATVLSAIAGGVFIIDCRVNNGGDLKDCWMTGLPYMGIGLAGGAGAAGGFKVGYETYNPNLRKPKDEELS